MTPTELKSKLDNEEDIILLDIRTPSEYDTCMIKGCIHIPLNELNTRIDELDKSKEVVVYCHSGGRSMYVVGLLRELGFNASNLTGGIRAWNQLS